MICVIDNYDSFVYNLVQYVRALGVECLVFRNDAVTTRELDRLKPALLLISPGPGSPDTAGASLNAVHDLSGAIPIFGVCLGHQTIGQAFGAKVRHAAVPMHGKCSAIEHDGRGLFEGLPSRLTVTRYHSLVVDPETLPEALEVTAWSPEGEVMGLRHREMPVESVQFHPESHFTDHGHQMMKNVLSVAGCFSPLSEELVEL